LEEQAKATANTEKLNLKQKTAFDTILEAVYSISDTNQQ
jgi:hypothetical protein